MHFEWKEVDLTKIIKVGVVVSKFWTDSTVLISNHNSAPLGIACFQIPIQIKSKNLSNFHDNCSYVCLNAGEMKIFKCKSFVRVKRFMLTKIAGKTISHKVYTMNYRQSIFTPRHKHLCALVAFASTDLYVSRAIFLPEIFNNGAANAWEISTVAP